MGYPCIYDHCQRVETLVTDVALALAFRESGMQLPALMLESPLRTRYPNIIAIGGLTKPQRWEKCSRHC